MQNIPISPAVVTATYQEDPSGNIGGTEGPDDLSDPVQSSTVNAAFSDVTNTLAYLYSLAKGINSGPAAASPQQPPALTGGYGISRIQQVANLAGLNFSPLDSGSVVFVPGYGLYEYFTGISLTADGIYVISVGSAGQWRNAVYALAGYGAGEGPGWIVPQPYGIAALDDLNTVPNSELPMSRYMTSAFADTFTGSSSSPSPVTGAALTGFVSNGGPLLITGCADPSFDGAFVSVSTTGGGGFYSNCYLYMEWSTSTTIAAGSNGASLPQSVIHVATTTALNPAGGTLTVVTGAGTESVTYSGVTYGSNPTLTGCSGGTGVMSTGGAVTMTVGSNNIGLVTTGYPAAGSNPAGSGCPPGCMSIILPLWTGTYNFQLQYAVSGIATAAYITHTGFNVMEI